MLINLFLMVLVLCTLKLGGCLGDTTKLGPLARTDLCVWVKGLLDKLMTLSYLTHKVFVKASKGSMADMAFKPTSKVAAPSKTSWSPPRTKTPWSTKVVPYTDCGDLGCDDEYIEETSRTQLQNNMEGGVQFS